MLYPTQLPGQRLGEKTALILHHHWYVFVRAVVLLLAFAALLVAFGWVLISLMPQLLDHPVWTPIAVLVVNIFVLLGWIFFANYFIEAYLDRWIVTTHRLIDIEQRGLFNRTVAELHLDRIQDIEVESRGIAATTLGFGRMVVTTAGASERFEFQDLPDPEGVRAMIFKLARWHQANVTVNSNR